MVLSTGDHIGTQINSDRQLWSVAGNLASVYRILFGMELRVDGLQIKPFIPENYGDSFQLGPIKYRNMTVDIEIEGYGDEIAEVHINGVKADKAFLAADLKGKQHIHIVMNEHWENSSDVRQYHGPRKIRPTTCSFFVSLPGIGHTIGAPDGNATSPGTSLAGCGCAAPHPLPTRCVKPMVEPG